MRETAIEVLGPVMRSATKSAAKYAVRKAPEMAMERMLPATRAAIVGPRRWWS